MIEHDDASVLTAATVGAAGVALRPSAPPRPTGTTTWATPTTSTAPTAAAARLLRTKQTFVSLLTALSRTCRRRAVLREEAVAAWCDELARRSRAGISLHIAVHDTASPDDTMTEALQPIRRALGRGATVTEAMSIERADLTPGADHLAVACSVIGIVASIGGSAAEPLDRVAAALRLRAVDRHERATQSSQASLSAHVLTVLQLLMLTVLLASDGDVRDVVTSRA